MYIELFEKIARYEQSFLYIFVEVFSIKPDFLINEEIRFSQVQVIDENGEKLGKLPINEAKQIAYDKGLDLVFDFFILSTL